MKLPFYLLALTSALLHAQGGSLTPPPGSPAPTMKSLDQVEARTPLVEGAAGVTIDPITGGITISESGSFFLAGNLSVTKGNGITINADNVSLDLNGFAISSAATPAAGDGIFSSNSHLTISKGRIIGDYSISEMDGSGFQNGINATAGNGIAISRISVSKCSGNGIRLSTGSDRITTTEACQVDSMGGDGIHANTVKDCLVTKCTTGGIKGSHVSGSEAATTGGIGIQAPHVDNCYARSQDGNGIDSEHVVNSTGRSTNATGIDAHNVSQCTGTSFNGDGISALYLVTHSQGTSYGNAPGTFGIKTDTAIGCFTNKLSADHKFNMP